MNRIAWIDWAKTFAIFLMTVGHTWMCPSIVCKIIYSFHMPLLFIISGYLMKSKPLIIEILSFILPIAFFSVINFIYELAMTPEQLGTHCFLGYSNESGYGYYIGVWYLQVLLLTKLIFRVPIVKQYYKLIAITIIAILSVLSCYYVIESSWYIERIIPSFPFIAVGLWLKEREDLIIRIKKSNILIIFIVSLIIVISNKSCDLHCGIYGYSYFLFFMGAVGLSLTFINLFSYIKGNNFISTCSQGTLLVLGLHMTLFYIIIPFIPGKLYVFGYIIIPILVMIICYSLIKLCLKYCPWTLGRFSKRTETSTK